MLERVILVTGTPCVGKTRISRLLASRLDAFYVNLTELALDEGLILGKDEETDSLIIDENPMRNVIRELIKKCEKRNAVIDGHYAASVVPKELGTHVFVLRRNPAELRTLMKRRGFSKSKLWENLASEILDISLVDALKVYEEEKICEIDTSGKSAEEIVDVISAVLNGDRKCTVGVVDWLGKLEGEGSLEEFLRI